MKKFGYIVVLVFLVTACKSTKSGVGASVSSMSPKKIIRNHYEANFSKETIRANIKVSYKDNKASQTVSVKFRMKRDSVIWMSGQFFGIPMAKIYITPNEVRFYEKLGKKYFIGDFTLLSSFLGTEVDFDIVQNLLLGQALVNLKQQRYESEVTTNSVYKLTPKKQRMLFDLLFWVNPSNFKIDKQEVRQPSEQKKVAIAYKEYQKVDNQQFPKKISIVATNKIERTFLNLEFKSVEFDKDLSFPFKIPEGYKKLELDE